LWYEAAIKTLVFGLVIGALAIALLIALAHVSQIQSAAW